MGTNLEDAPEFLTWRESLLGDVDIVSPENEKIVWKTLQHICRDSALRAEEWHNKLEQQIKASEFNGWMRYAAQAISNLWLEEKRVAQAVGQSIVKGETID